MVIVGTFNHRWSVSGRLTGRPNVRIALFTEGDHTEHPAAKGTYRKKDLKHVQKDGTIYFLVFPARMTPDVPITIPDLMENPTVYRVKPKYGAVVLEGELVAVGTLVRDGLAYVIEEYPEMMTA